MVKPVLFAFSLLLGASGAAAPAFAQDLVPPSLGLVSPVDYSYLNSLPAVSGTAFDSSGILEVQLQITRFSDGYYWDGASFAPGQFWLSASVSSLTWSYADLPAWANGASYAVYARALDLASNWSVVYATSAFHYDTGAPTSVVTLPGNGSDVLDFALGVRGTAWDTESATSMVWAKVTRASDNRYWNGALTQWTAEEAWNLAVGSAAWSYTGLPESSLTYGSLYFAESRAVDLAGNLSPPAAPISFTYAGAATDILRPYALILHPLDGLWTESLDSIEGTAGDNVAVASVVLSFKDIAADKYWSGSAWDSAVENWLTASVWPSSWTYTSVPAWVSGSSYAIRVSALDSSGNASLGISSVAFHFESGIPAGCGPTESARSGAWSVPSTWRPALIPAPCNSVTILAGHSVTVDVATAVAGATAVNGTLTFSRSGASAFTLSGGDLSVNPGGTLDMGNGGSPIPAGAAATLVLSSGAYAGQYSLIINNGGNFSARGAAKTPYAYATQSITTSDTSLKVYGSTSTEGWQAGDTITIGPSSGAGLASTSKRVITGITGGPEYTVSWTGGALPYARNPTAAAPVIVANLTRNVLVRSSGTVVDGAMGNSAYIKNLARNTTSFAVSYGEFAYLGDMMGFKYSLAFDSLSRGEISSSTLRDSSYGLYLYNSSGNTFYRNNFHANWYGGIKLHNSSLNILTENIFHSNYDFGVFIYHSSRNNTLTGNNSYSNSSYGLYLYDACNDNTLTGNNSYSNSGYGLDLVSASNNTLAWNNFYSNAAAGIYLDIASNSNLFLENNAYSNSGAGISPSDSLSNVFVGGSLGFDRFGADKPDSGGEVAFDPAHVSSLVLKESRVNPATGVAAAGMNKAGSYLLSYNQDADTGTLRLWGNYIVADSVLALDYNTRLYEPANTVPKVLRGAGHSLANAVAKDAALSELITVRFLGTAGDLWEVVGSSSGLLGGFSRGPSDVFNFSHPKVAFSLLTGPELNIGDTLEFASVAPAGDAGSPKKLLFGPAAPGFNGGRSKLEIAPAGGLLLRGRSDGAANTLLDRLSPSSTYYTIVASGTFTADRSSFTNLDQDGLQLSGDKGVALSSSSFDFLGFAAGTNSYLTARDLTAAATFYNVSFGLSRSSAGYGSAYNIRVEGNYSGTSVYFKKALISLGEMWGEAYELDPGGKVAWFDAVPAAPSGCGIEETRNVGKSGYIYATIQSAIDSLPRALGATACAVIKDAAVYNEQVTVRDFDNNGYRLKIMADPELAGPAPAVSPPALSTAAFQLFSDSVTLQGINVAPALSLAYGVFSSSADVALSSVSVISGGNIFSAGVVLSSRSLVSDSGIAVQAADGLLLEGELSVISQSTIASNAAGFSALTFSGASSNTVTGSYLSNPGGRAVFVSTGANGNAIVQSVILSDSNAPLMFGALYVQGSSSNTVTDTVISNPAGVSAYLGPGADHNSILRSTLTSAGTGYQALRISGGSYNTVDRSFLSAPGGYALYIGLNSGSDHNSVSRSTIASNSAALSALYIYQASSNTVTGSVISNPAGNGAHLWDAANGNLISYSSVTSNAAGKYAVLFSGVSSNTVESCYLGNPAGYGAGLTDISAYNSIAGSTISVNSAYTALSIDNSSNNTVTRSNISNPSGYGALIGFGAEGNTLSYDSVAVNAAAYFAVKLQNAAFNAVSGSFLSNPAGVAYADVFGYGNLLERSTVTSSAWAYSAVFVDASENGRVENSYVRGANALFVRDSTGTIAAYNVLAATNAAGTGLRVDMGGDTLSVLNAVSAAGTGILVNAGSSGAVSVSSTSVAGAAYGLSAVAQGAGGSLAVSGINFDGLAAGATAVNFLGGSFVSTITAASFSGTGPAVNVNGSLLLPGSRITMRDYFGSRSGQAYENDPSGYVDWSSEDTAAPTAAVIWPADGSILDSLARISGTAADTVSVSSVVVALLSQETGLFWDGSVWAAGEAWLDAPAGNDWAYVNIPSLVDGSSYTVSARAMDSSGNWSAVSTAVFRYVAPELSSASFSGVGINSLSVNWGTTFSTDTVYHVRVTTHAAETPYVVFAATTALTYGFTGLTPNSRYYGFVSTTAVTGYLASGSGVTLADRPGYPAFDPGQPTAPVAFTSTGGMTVSWSAGGNPGYTQYLVEVSSAAEPFLVIASYTVAGATSAAVGGLDLNREYAARVAAVNLDGVLSYHPDNWPYGGLSLPEVPANVSLVSAAYSSVTVSWEAGNNPPWTIYEVRAGTSPLYDGYVSTFMPFSLGYSSNSLSIAGLQTDMTYYLDVAAGPGYHTYDGFQRADSLSFHTPPGPDGAPAGSVGGTSDPLAAVTVAGVLPGAREVLLELPAPAFAAVTQVAVAESSADACGHLVAGRPLAAEIYAQAGRQPQAPVRLELSYNSAEAVAGVGADSLRLFLAQYSSVAGGCVPVETEIDPGTRLITSTITGTGPYQLILDTAAPAAVSDLAAAPWAGQVALTWTAPGNQGVFGELFRSTFTIQYTTLAADAASPVFWSTAAAQVRISTTGVSPGAFETHMLAGLPANTTHYFGLWSTDAAGNASGVSNLSSVSTLSAPPAGPYLSAVFVTSAAVAWTALPALPSSATCEGYLVEASTSPDFGGTRYSSATRSADASSLKVTGLTEGGTYYFRAGSLNWASVPNYGYAGSTVTYFQLPVGLAGHLAGTAPGINSINWTWDAGTLASADLFAIYHDGVLASTAAFAASGTSIQSGLTPNTSHFLGVAGRNAHGQGPLEVSGPVYTRAAVPSGLGAQVAISSAVLTWGLNGNSAGTVAQLWRSVDNMIFSSIFEGPVASYTDAAIEECSPYYYRVRNRNGAGLYTAFGGTIGFETRASTPTPPSGLYAEALDGARIALNWDPSPWPGVTQYDLYYDNAGGTIDYGTPYRVFSSTVSSWTAGPLNAGSTYKFALRARNRCGIEEANTAVSASAQAVGVLSGVRAAIKTPQTGKKIKGSNVTIVAEIILGLPSQIKQVRFQYRLAGGAAWLDIAAANANHPNPDVSGPYFVHWDADLMPSGTYELRALATDIFNAADAAPPAITVVIDPVDYDTRETVVGGELQKEQKINNAVASTVQAADETSALVSKVVIPAGAVDVTTVALTLVSNPASKPVPPSGSEELSLAVKINLSSGQSLLSAGKTAAVTLSYKDDNGDGMVDGTNAAVDRLRMYSAPDGGGAWTELATSVDREKRTISGLTAHFSFFSVFAAPSSTLTGIKAYPNPWQPGSGGRFDAAAGITFANLPTGARLKIFTLMGELVRELEVAPADSGTKVWDGRNSEGHKAAGGVYIVLVKSGSTDRTFKVAVER